METKLRRIADKSAHETRPIFTSINHLLNEEMLIQCHKELAGDKAVGVDNTTKAEKRMLLCGQYADDQGT